MLKNLFEQNFHKMGFLDCIHLHNKFLLFEQKFISSTDS